MLKKVTSMVCLTAAAAIAASMPTFVSAEEVALTFVSNDLTLVGEFTDYRDNGYVIETIYGTIHVPAAMVLCEGADCVVTVAES